MIIELPEDVESSVRAQVNRGEFRSVDHALAEAWRVFLEQRTIMAEPASRAEAQREVLASLCEQLDGLPASPVSDGLTNRDHDQILYSR